MNLNTYIKQKNNQTPIVYVAEVGHSRDDSFVS